MPFKSRTPRAAEVAKRILQVRNGSREALGRLLEVYRRYLLRLAIHKLGAAVRAKVDPADLVQDTFLEAVRDFPRFEGTTEQELLGWLRRILCNNVVNLHRHFETDKRQVVREMVLEEAVAGDLLHHAVKQSEQSSRQGEFDEHNEHLEQAMRRLPKPHRQVLLLHTLEELTFVQIANKLGSTAEAVRKRYGRAAVKLANLLRTSPGILLR
jgi:RNA polymerase sigma-70 factor (ECF subfamily)